MKRMASDFDRAVKRLAKAEEEEQTTHPNTDFDKPKSSGNKPIRREEI